MSNNSEDIVNDFIKAITILMVIFSVLFLIFHYAIFSLIFVVLICSIFLVLFLCVKGYKFSKKHIGRWIDLILSILFGWLAWSSWLKGDTYPNYNGWLVVLGWCFLLAAVAFFEEFLRKKEQQV